MLSVSGLWTLRIYGTALNATQIAALSAESSSSLATVRISHSLASDGSQDLLAPAGDGVANLLKYAFNMVGSGAGQGTTLATPNAAVLTPGGTTGLP